MTAVAPVSGLLTFLQVLTPLIGVLGALFGAAAGFITMLIKWNEWKAARKAAKENKTAK